VCHQILYIPPPSGKQKKNEGRAREEVGLEIGVTSKVMRENIGFQNVDFVVAPRSAERAQAQRQISSIKAGIKYYFAHFAVLS